MVDLCRLVNLLGKSKGKISDTQKIFLFGCGAMSFSPGHSPRKQSMVSSHSPLHSEPPYEGPLHSLVLCMVPLEQEAEQELQLDHSFHTPSTEDDEVDRQDNTGKLYVKIWCIMARTDPSDDDRFSLYPASLLLQNC